MAYKPTNFPNGIKGPLVTGVSTATATAGAATLNALVGTVTTEALTTAQDATYTLTITDALAEAGDVVMTSIANGTNTAGLPIVTRATVSAGSIVILVTNKISTATALNGTLAISFVLFKAQ